MPVFQSRLVLPRPAEEVFEFLATPANLIQVAPPEAHLQLVSGPERLELGATFVCKSKHLGVSQHIAVEVIDFRPGQVLIIQQQRGPLKKWVHATLFADAPEGTEMHDRIDFEPPGGLLGLLVTAQFIDRTLHSTFRYRDSKLRERFGGTAG